MDSLDQIFRIDDLRVALRTPSENSTPIDLESSLNDG